MEVWRLDKQEWWKNTFEVIFPNIPNLKIVNNHEIELFILFKWTTPHKHNQLFVFERVNADQPIQLDFVFRVILLHLHFWWSDHDCVEASWPDLWINPFWTWFHCQACDEGYFSSLHCSLRTTFSKKELASPNINSFYWFCMLSNSLKRPSRFI